MADLGSIVLTRGGEQRQQKQQQPELQSLLGDGRSTKDGKGIEPSPLAMAMARPVPPAGLRATFTGRFRTPITKKRRVGGIWGGSGGGSLGVGVGGGGGGGSGNLAGTVTQLFESRGVVDERGGEGGGEPVGPTTWMTSGRDCNRAGSDDLSPLEAATATDGSRRPITAPTSASPTIGADAAATPVPRPSTQRRVLLPSIVASGKGLLLPDSWNAEELAREEGAGDRATIGRGPVVKDGGRWKEKAFVDINVADDHVSPSHPIEYW